jgi:hypothetical protein
LINFLLSFASIAWKMILATLLCFFVIKLDLNAQQLIICFMDPNLPQWHSQFPWISALDLIKNLFQFIFYMWLALFKLEIRDSCFLTINQTYCVIGAIIMKNISNSWVFY